MLVLTRGERQAVMIGDNIRVVILRVASDGVRIAIDAPKEIVIMRGEIAGDDPPRRPNEPEIDVTFDEFRSLVADMRAAQKEYFRTRSSESLSQSKRLESEVDKALLRLQRGEGRTLFDGLEPANERAR